MRILKFPGQGIEPVPLAVWMCGLNPRPPGVSSINAFRITDGTVDAESSKVGHVSRP